MWILDARQTNATDQFTIENEPVRSIDLMERAAIAFVDRFSSIFPKQGEVAVFCGPGNNGGDGLAIARLLHQKGYTISAFYIHTDQKFSLDFLENKAKLENEDVLLVDLNENHASFKVDDSTILIDAIFGSGLNKPVKGIFKNTIEQLNQLANTTISVDVPTGLHQDKYIKGEKVRADYTIAFQFPKLSFLLPENELYVGKWFVEDIGLDIRFLKEEQIQYQIIDKVVLKLFLKERNRQSHKGTYGHALIVAGSYGKMGAALLCTKAALKAGCGLVTAHLPKCGLAIMQSSLWEAMVLPDMLDKIISEAKDTQPYAALALGSGLGQDAATIQSVEAYLKQNIATVVDADALNIIANHSHLKKLVNGKILTPHPKEFERLFGKAKNNYHRLEILKSASAELDCTIILKDAYTCIASPLHNSLWFNTTGNNGMATAGSGDVLTGLIAGLLAQGYTSFEAAIVGVYLHGLSGNLYIEKHAPHSLIATDLIQYFGKAFQSVFNT